jgi:opacity protein-like surface antigen
MKTILFFAFFIAITLVFPFNSFSQSGSFSIHAGPAFPLNDFGDDDIDDEDSGLAGTGFELGGKYVYQLNESGLGLFAGADLIYNGLASDVKDDLEDDMDGVDNLKFYSYINVPLMAGINYSFNANNQVALFGEFGLGVNLLKVTNMSFEYDHDDYESRYDPSTKLGFKIGGGLIFNDAYSLEVNYLGLGEQEIDGEIEIDGDTENIPGSRDLKVNIFTLTFGVKF